MSFMYEVMLFKYIICGIYLVYNRNEFLLNLKNPAYEKKMFHFSL